MGQSKVVTVVLSEYAFALDVETQNQMPVWFFPHLLQSGTSGITNEPTDSKGKLTFLNILN